MSVHELKPAEDAPLEPAECPQCGCNNWGVYLSAEAEEAVCVCTICGAELSPLMEFEADGD